MQLQANEGVPHTRTPLNRAAEGEARKDAAVHSGTDAGSLLVLLNPGRVTRNCLLDMIGAARALGLRVLTYELGPLWEMRQSGRQPDASAFAEWLRANNVKAVLGYAHNGLLEFPVARTADGRTVSFFEQLGIPHLMWWTDHPQWASERIALQADLQPLLASENQFHIVKSEAAAREIRGILGWRNVHGMPVAENPDRYGAKDPAEPDFDIVCISGAPPSLDPTLAKPLERDDPDSTEIMRFVEGMVNRRLESLWRERAPARLVVDLDRLGRAWSEGRRIEPLAVCFDLFDRLSVEHPDAANWLRSEYRVYFDALEILWEFGRWQRTFYLRYLSRYFKVGVFGSDWSSVEMGPGGWVDYDQQANIYARGRVALNIPQAGDEQGVAHKPFQIAAANVPMAHLFRKGIEDCFELGEEVLTFQTPREARDRIAALLGDAKRRETMAAAAHARLRRDHTWLVRLPEMLALLPHRFKTDRPDELAGTVPETPRSRAERPLQPA